MSNFDFILKNKIFKTFAEASLEAENSLAISNVTCCIMCRRSLELAVKWLYENDLVEVDLTLGNYFTNEYLED